MDVLWLTKPKILTAISKSLLAPFRSGVKGSREMVIIFLSVRCRKNEASLLEVSSVSTDLAASYWGNRILIAIKHDLGLQC